MSLLTWWYTSRQHRGEGQYVQQIQALKPSQPLALPPVKRLKGKVVKPKRTRKVKAPVAFPRAGAK